MAVKFSIRKKLVGSFLIVIVLLLAAVGVAYSGLNNMGNTKDVILEKSEYVNHVTEIQALVAEQWLLYTDYSLTHKPEILEEAEALDKDIAAEAQELRFLMTVEERANLDSFLLNHEKFAHDGNSISFLYVAGDWTGGNIAMKKWNSSGAAMLSALGEMEADSMRGIQSATADADEAEQSSITLTVIIAVLGTLIALALGVIGSENISRGVKTVANGMKKISTGDLTVEISNNSSDEIGDMCHSYNEMQVYLRETAEVAQKISEGDLRVTVKPKSKKDVLGNAFRQMAANLSRMIGGAREVAGKVAEGSGHLSRAAEQASQATQQIASTSQLDSRGSQRAVSGSPANH